MVVVAVQNLLAVARHVCGGCLLCIDVQQVGQAEFEE